MTGHSMPTPDRRKAGLTLLEVLAAAMIFAMVMTVLIGTSSTAVHNVGQSARRLEANLLADEILADLEIQMKQGYAPEVSELPTESEDFAIQTTRTDVIPGDPNASPASALQALAGSTGDITAMLATGLPEVGAYLRQYDIEVSWVEQEGTQTVRRTTFAYDWDLAAAELPELFANGGADIEEGQSNPVLGPDGMKDHRPANEKERDYYRSLGGRQRLNGHNAGEDWRERHRPTEE